MKKDKIECRMYPDGISEWIYHLTDKRGNTVPINIDFETAQKEQKEQAFRQNTPGRFVGNVFVIEYILPVKKEEIEQPKLF